MSVLRDSPHLTDHDDRTVDEYRAVSGWAVAALILGLLGPLALVDIWLSLIPLAGIVVAVVALVRIAVLTPALTGRKTALAGLFLSTLCISAAGADYVVYWQSVHREAQRFAKVWFAFLAEGRPEKAHQLTLAPQVRQPLNETLAEFYRENEDWQEDLERYIRQPVVARLLALGSRARARYHATEASGRGARLVVARQLFTVIYDDAKQDARSFWVRLTVERGRFEYGQAAWRIIDAEEP